MSHLLDDLRSQARESPVSGIVDVMNYGRGRPGLIPLWAGEGDLPTPAFICEAATRGLAAGETYYTWQRGIPELREALAAYHGRLYGKPFEADQFYVTGGGMQAIQISIQATAGAGDEVVLPTPAWPNFAAAAGIGGAKPVSVPMRFGNQGWHLDLEEFFAAVTERTRALIINSPGNPSGWVATRDELRAILEFARERGIWIISDEVYGRFYWRGDAERAPSFLDVAEAEDRVIYVNTFSKMWAMTGWRIGWICAHPSLGQVLENLVQYSTSGVAAFMQRAGLVALERGEDFALYEIERARKGRKIVTDALQSSGRVRYAAPDGAFYALFAIEGYDDTPALAKKLIDEANIGLAPGTAFGDGGEAFMRLCFLRTAGQMEDAMVRLSQWLARR